MTRNIILFGPPGVGKSTLIGYLKTQGQRAIDLEDVYPNRIRFQLPNILEGTFIGAADLDPKRKYPHNAKKVLLWMPQDKYEERRAARDAKYPEKAGQAKHQMMDWYIPDCYDLVLDVSPGIPYVFSQLMNLYRGEPLRGKLPKELIHADK